jgi:hypothetical protein
MRTDSTHTPQDGVSQHEAGLTARSHFGLVHAWLVVAVSALVGLFLMAGELLENSATYDEVAYVRVAAHWWRTGDQESITRMGSPLTFWKIQQVPVLWALDRAGFRAWVDDPIGNQEALLPLVRAWSLLIWLIALVLCAWWSHRLYGPRAMALAAALFALSPNLLAHGSLVTMELPLLACTTAIFLLFWQFLQTGKARFFWSSALVAGLALSCKFTTVVLPPILAVAWCATRWRAGERGLVRAPLAVAARMAGFVLVMVFADLLVTGFALLPLSESNGPHPVLEARLSPGVALALGPLLERPIPQDWVAFATQMRHQRSGGPSYLFGERTMNGWWYYYLVALAVKVPLGFWLLFSVRAWLGRRLPAAGSDALLPLAIALFVAAASLCSTRNYGVRYLLPVAPLAIVWVSALAEGGRWARAVAYVGLLAQALAVASVHPHELSYFNVLAGGPRGGKRILADSNLDWGQGAKRLSRLQRTRPEYRDLTLYYFGDTDPAHYGVTGRRHVIDAGELHAGLPMAFEANTSYVAVSTSLQHGPWGPPGYFRSLQGVEPVVVLPDQTIAIFRAADVVGLKHSRRRIR